MASESSYNCYYEVELDGFFTSRELAQAALDGKLEKLKIEEERLTSDALATQYYMMENNSRNQERYRNTRIVKVSVSLKIED